MTISRRFSAMVAMSGLAFLLQGITGDKTNDSILDRLERRLLEQEREAVSFDANLNSPDKPAKTSYRYNQKIIKENTPSSDDLTKLTAAVTELEAQVEYLSSQVHQAKQKILQDASINNLINIATRLESPDSMGFRSLSVTIDGHKVYEQNAAMGLWIPEESIPLFRGPMQPGNHRIDFEARIVQKSKESLPIQTDTFHQVNESFNFEIPEGQVSKKWEIALSDGSSQGTQTKAEFKALK